MTASPNAPTPAAGKTPLQPAPKSRPSLLRLPGVLAISFYMILLAVTAVLGVANKRFPPLALVFPVFFIAAGLGLPLLFRWAWALALAAVALLSAVFLWIFSTQHTLASLAQGLLNLVFFLYLVRTDVREKLR